MGNFNKKLGDILTNSGHQTVHKLNLLIFRMSHLLELVLAILLTTGLILSAVTLIPSLAELAAFEHAANSFTHFLESVFTLMVGVEALKMLCKHTPGATLEVLLFALARAIVVEHTNIAFMIAGTGCIAVIFLIRKFLFVNDFDPNDTEETIFSDINPDEHLFGPSAPPPNAPHQHQRLSEREQAIPYEPDKHSSFTERYRDFSFQPKEWGAPIKTEETNDNQ